MTDTIQIHRTGNSVSFNGHEYLVTFPSGDKITIWSPPWNEMSPEEEDAGALMYARELWDSGEYVRLESE